MFTVFKRYLPDIKRMAGVEVSLLSDGKVVLQLVQLSKKSNMLTMEKQAIDLDKIESLKEHISSDTAISLTIQGKGILNKKVVATPEADLNKIFRDALPNANLSEFYIQSHRTPQACFLSIIRKTLLDSLLDQFTALDLPIVSVSLGAFAVCSLFPVLAIHTGTLAFAGHQMQIEGDALQDYSFKEVSMIHSAIHLENEVIDEAQLIAYATAFQILSGQAGQASVEVDRVRHQKEELSQKNIFKRAGWTILSFFLLVLLANFLVFDYYSKANSTLASKEENYGNLLSQIDTLEKKVKEKEHFIAGTGWLKTSRISFLTDRLAASVPSTIQLSELSVNPLNEKATKASKDLSFDPGILKLSGTCKRPTDLNPWIKEMKGFDWVKVVDIQHYAFDYKTGTGNFDIRIELR